MKYKFLILAIALQSALFAQDSTKTAFSLKEAQDYAIANNINLKNMLLDVDIAQKKIWETTAIGLPQVKANLGHTYMIDIPVTLLPAQIFNPQAPEGMMMPVKFGTDHNSSAELQLSQLIFSGEYLVGLKASKIYKELSLTQVKKTEDDIKSQVSQTYQLILIAQARTKILEQNIESTQKIYDDMQAMYQAGFVQQTDADQLKITLSRLKNGLSTATSQIEIAKNLLKFQIGLPLNQPIELTETLDNISSQFNFDNVYNQEFNLTSNIDYKMLDVQENLQKLNLQREKSTLLPTISAFYSHKQSMQSNDFEVFSGGIWYKSNVVGLNVSIPIFGSGQKLSRISQAKISLDKVKNGKLMLQDNLDIGYIRAKSDLKTAFDTYQVEKENKDLSYKIFENAQTRLKNGTMSTLDFNQAQMQYIGTEDAYFQALSRLLDAKINLEKLLNQH